MVFNWFRNKKDKSVLNFIKGALFPPISRYIEDGTEFFVDRSIDSNLYAVLTDLQHGINDEHTHATLQFCIDQLTKVRNQYKIHSEIKSDQTTTIYMVGTNNND